MKARSIDVAKLLPFFFEVGKGGLMLSGDSGTGKSNLLELLFRSLMTISWAGYLFIDPHGSTAASLYKYSLTLPARFRRRVRYIRVCSSERVVPINPLMAPGRDEDPILWESRMASKASHVAHILLHAWGERDFNSKPVLFKWTTRLLDTLAHLGLSLADAAYFLDTKNPLYHALTQAVPDVLARNEFAELAEMRPVDREQILASTKNRFLGWLRSPLVRLTLGRAQGAVDLGSLIRRRMIVLVDLDPVGALSREDREIFGNLWLSEALYAIFNTPAPERTPFFIGVDELPVFASSAPLLAEILPQARKYLVRFLLAFQGTNFFPDRTDDRLLHAIVGQCRARFVFGHGDPVDARFFGELVQLGRFNANAVKHVQKTPTQFTVGHDLATLTDRSSNQNEGASISRSSETGVSGAISETRTTMPGSATETQSTDGLRGAVARATTRALGDQTSQSTTNGTSRAVSMSSTRSASHGVSLTRKQQLVPRILTRRIVTGVQFFSPDEQFLQAASRIARLKVGEAVLHVTGHGTALVRLPLVVEPMDNTPKYAAKLQRRFEAWLHGQPEYATPAAIEAERRSLLLALLEEIARLPAARQSIHLLPAERIATPRRTLPKTVDPPGSLFSEL